jgi:pyrophosphatase PpaX
MPILRIPKPTWVRYAECVKPTLLFDLDGTILDSTNLLLTGYKHTIRTHLDRETTDEDWMPHFGRPLRMQMAAFSEDLADEMTVTYRRFYAENHETMLGLYPGVGDMIATLHGEGYRMGVVTSKKTRFAVRGLQIFCLQAFFEVIIGEDEVTHHKPDPEAVLLALSGMDVAAADAWMIGDSPWDMRAGRAAGCRTAAVLWGPFSRETLVPENPDLFVEQPQDLPILLRNTE